MITTSKIIALIPARSGSKGLPNKNILKLGDKPLLAYSILAAKEAGIEKIIVSTDSEEYSNIAKSYGADVPLLRPSEISTDSSSISEAIKHTLDYYKTQDQHYEYIILLQPTSPLRTFQHILEAIDRYNQLAVDGDETLASVTEAPDKMRWLMESSEGFVKFCFDVNKNNPQRQRLDKLYLPNGAIYIAPTTGEDVTFFNNKTIAYQMSANESIDIDTLEDFRRAEEIINQTP